MDIDNFDYKGETVKLDKERHLKYTIAGMKLLAKKYGSVMEAFRKLQSIGELTDTELDLIVDIAHAGLIHEDPKIAVADVSNLLDMRNMTGLTLKMIAAFNGSNSDRDGDNEGEAKA